MEYFICFCLSLLFFYLSEKNKKQKNYMAFSLLALFIPCFLAGIRANSVGTDVVVYLEPMIDNVYSSRNLSEYLSSSWQQGWVIRRMSEIEIGFSLLVYLIIKLLNSKYILQFIIQALTIIPIYIGLKKNHQKNIWIGMLVYFCMFYNISLNIMRQAISMSFVFLAFQYLIHNQKKYFFIFLLIACLFHNTALVGLFLFGIYEFLNLKSNTNDNLNKKTISPSKRMIALVLFGFLFFVLQEQIIKFFQLTGFSYYTRYFAGTVSFLPNQIIVRLPILFMFFILRKQLINKLGSMFYFYVCCVVYAIIFSQFASVNSVTYRIAMFFSIFSISYIPEICSVKSRVKFGTIGEVKSNTIIMVGYLIIWWVYYCFILLDSSIPFVSDFKI